MIMSADLNKPIKSGADVVVRTLEAQGVKYVFGVPGAKIDTVFNSLVDSDIQTVVCRHEQNAAFIAGGIGRMTGKAGVAIATSGPGVSNLTTGLATANSEGDPVVALGGAVAHKDELKQIHQTMDSVSLLKPVTKSSVAVGAPQAVAEALNNAFRVAEGGRPGAAFVSLPMDVMTAPAGTPLLTPPIASGPGPANSGALAAAAKLISEAENPVVLLGLLASKPANAEATNRFIEQCRLAVVGTFQAAGAIGAHLWANFGGRVGQIANQPADRLLDSADLIITIGYDPVEYWPEEWNGGKARKIVHIDIGPAALDVDYCPTIELMGDIAETLRSLSSMVRRARMAVTSARMLDAIATERDMLAKASEARGGSPIHPLRLVAELQKVLQPDVTLCLDMGSFHLWIARHLHSFRARQVLISNGQQTLGVALPWAIAASLVRPSEKVISISGDGGFLFSAMELETAVRLGVHIVHMIWIDGTYDMVLQQEIIKYGRGSGVQLGSYDPVKYAEAFGATGTMIRGADEIAPTLAKAMDASGPVVIGVPVDYRDNPELFEVVRPNAFH
jgi:acetolactate synthase I/II/III large subunit